jgi:hypothetical protein
MLQAENKLIIGVEGEKLHPYNLDNIAGPKT